VTRLLICLFGCLTLLATPAAAQTVELSERTFWLGETPRTLDSEPPFIALNRVDWIDAILQADPDLQSAVVHIEETYTPTIDFQSPNESDILLGPDRLPASYDLPDYRIYGPSVSTARSFTYVPVEPEAGFKVECGQTDDGSRMSICVVFASYAPDDHIKLKARLYFPPDPADRPSYFRDVVERMREVARCLDVTDGRSEIARDGPGLLVCLLAPMS
jgi:hypothetical protein